MVLRNRVREKRMAAGLAVDDLKAKAGISQGTVFHMELHPEYRPGIDIVLKVAAVLGCEVTDLYWLEPSPAEGS